MNIPGQWLSSPGASGGCRDACFQGEGALASSSCGGGGDADAQVSGPGRRGARLGPVRPLAALSLGREHYGGFWGWGRGTGS